MPLSSTDLDSLKERCRVPLLEPDQEVLQKEGLEALNLVIEDFLTLADQPVGRDATRSEMEALLREALPEKSTDFSSVLEEFRERVKPFAFRTNHPRFLAFVPAAPTFYSILGELLCAGHNFFSGVWVEAAGPSQVEIQVLDWFKEIVGYPSEAQGVLTSGGSEANLTALVVAREQLTLDQRTNAVLYLTEQRHWSVDRAAKVMGLLPDQIHPVPSDSEYRMSVPALQNQIQTDREKQLYPWAILANGGATNTGTVDPLEDLSQIGKNEGIWLHVDAAYGWSAVLHPEGQRELRGMELADSITLDPHKWFGQTFETGCLLVRDGRRLGQTFSLKPEYLQDVLPTEMEINFADHGIALTRRFRALRIWLSIKVLGLDWFKSLIQRGIDLATLAAHLIEDNPHFELLSPRKLSVVCFRYRPSSTASEDEIESLNQNLIRAIRTAGLFFLSSTRLDGKLSLRFCFVNWRTTAQDVEAILDWISDQGSNFAP